MTLSSLRSAFVFLLLATLVSSCAGHGHVRATQAWSEVDDPRLFRVCHVTNYGSGYCLQRTAERILILANAHVVGDADVVDIYLPNRTTRSYDHFEAEVLATAHPTKIDLALLVVRNPPPGDHYELQLASPFDEGELREAAELLDITSPDRPASFSGPIVEQTVLWAGSPDDFGSTTYDVSVACLHGGILQANSGSPVFEGNQLIGINHYSPVQSFVRRVDASGARIEDTVYGIGVTTPSRIRAFLEANHYGHLLKND